jgi:periplasmic divalent cation tolerance protein
MEEVFLVTTTSNDRGILQSIANGLIERSLAACVQIGGPVASHYRWQGQLECSSEWTLTAKTRQTLVPAVEADIRARHNYQLPEIIWLPVGSSREYQAWVIDQTQS